MSNVEETLTPVERAALAASTLGAIYPPEEKIATIVVENFPQLGKLAAMRFVEWVQHHPGGVISLPTGKTPEHFITWVRKLLAGWDTPEARAELEAAGVDPAVRPDMKSLHFVQIDEFYPIKPTQTNSFYHYVNKFYIRGFGLDAAKAMLIDCSQIGLVPGQTVDSVWPDQQVDLSLRVRQPRGDLERTQAAVLARIDQWCQEYEAAIRALGGIGFFLGGIGPDGHVGFNVRGSDHFSTTRLTATNYETQAAAATDLGGIEVSRKRLVITIGLGTLTFNPRAAVIIISAGEAKAPVVAAAVRGDKSVLVPGTALHALPHARFYVTRGSAKRLPERQVQLLAAAAAVSDQQVERILVDLAAAGRKRIVDLTESDILADRFGRVVLDKRPENAETLTQLVRDRLIAKIQHGAATLSGTKFLHTEPHHDDVMLGYLPAVVRHVRDRSNEHHFVTLTSGFTSVSNAYLQGLLGRLREYMKTAEFAELYEADYFEPADRHARQRDVWQYLDGVAAAHTQRRDEGTSRRLMRNMIRVYDEHDVGGLEHRMFELGHYLQTEYPGRKDPRHVQSLKGMCREWEVECLWGYFGWNCDHVIHLRLGFYTGDIFTEEPTVSRDVPPIVELLERVQPDLVTVALDPEASGPDTHYKVMQAVCEAMRTHVERTGRQDIRVWGYRNVWYRFHPAEADVFIPVSLNMFSVMRSAFLNTFGSQRDASFPSHEHDGPFCELAQKIQVDQYGKIKTCLGRDWFHKHDNPLIRATRGLVFLRDLSLAEFGELSRELRKATDGD